MKKDQCNECVTKRKSPAELQPAEPLPKCFTEAPGSSGKTFVCADGDPRRRYRRFSLAREDGNQPKIVGATTRGPGGVLAFPGRGAVMTHTPSYEDYDYRNFPVPKAYLERVAKEQDAVIE